MENIIVYSTSIESELSRLLDGLSYDKVFVLCDTNTQDLALPCIQSTITRIDAIEIVLSPGDENKDLNSLNYVWEQLSTNGASRHSLLINLGGGMITDIGGFAASTFKRGIKFINIPTTLLAMVDASVGGKTGINFMGLKNEIGVFNTSVATIIDPIFLKTLDSRNLYSGYAEMIKHGVISTKEHWKELMRFDISNGKNQFQLMELIKESLNVKSDVINKDPYERKERKSLNFGHTLGHAIESYMMQSAAPVLHGYAVAWGMIGELYLSYMRHTFPKEILDTTVSYIYNYYGSCSIAASHIDKIYELMLHDKKNREGEIRPVLLSNIGSPIYDEKLNYGDVNMMMQYILSLK